MEEIKLGTKVKDRISGFTGIAYKRCTFLYDTPTVCVIAEETTAGKPPEDQWFSEPRLEAVEGGKKLIGYKREL